MFDVVFNFANYRYNPHAVPLFAAGLLVFVIASFILFQTKKTVKNISFFFFCLSLTLWLGFSGVVYLANDPQTALWWYKSFVFLGVVNIMPNFYLFSMATTEAVKERMPTIILGYTISNVIYLLALTTNLFITTPNLYFWGYYPHYEPAVYSFFIIYGLLFLSSEINLWRAYKAETIPIKRAQIITIFSGLIVGFFASFDFVSKVSSLELYPFGFIPSFILSSMVSYSVIRHKAFDIETVIHKTLLWMVSFFIILVPIFVLYRLSLPLLDQSVVFQTLFGISSFFILVFYLRVVQPKVDHLFQRRQANLEEISTQFTRDLVHLEGIENLVRRIDETISQSLYPKWIDIFVCDDIDLDYHMMNRKEEDGRILNISKDDLFLQWLSFNNVIVYADFIEIDPRYSSIRDQARSYFDLTKATVAIPLVLNERLVGVINLGAKANLKRYRAVDFHFLTSLKNQSAIAISNSLIYQNIEQQVYQRTQELVDVQKQLVQAEKLATVGTLSGGVAHEINNPLAAILMNVQMLLMSVEDKDDQGSLKLIEEATQRCRGIVQKLMDYAKKPLESNGLKPIDLADVLKKTVAFIRFQLEQDNITLNVASDDDAYKVMGNRNELEQVLTNLILNARDAIKEVKASGKIRIILSKRDGLIGLEVKDEGAGILSEVQSKIFDPFFTTKEVGKGLGLGLSICQSIVEKHSGNIEVKSKKGKGATFKITLPEYVNEEVNV